jgi:hypothetical protein
MKIHLYYLKRRNMFRIPPHPHSVRHMRSVGRASPASKMGQAQQMRRPHSSQPPPPANPISRSLRTRSGVPHRAETPNQLMGRPVEPFFIYFSDFLLSVFFFSVSFLIE